MEAPEEVAWQDPPEYLLWWVLPLLESHTHASFRLVCRSWRIMHDLLLQRLHARDLPDRCDIALSFPSLRELEVCGPHVADHHLAMADVAPLAQLTALSTLKLKGVGRLRGTGLEALACMTRLTRLDVAGWREMTDKRVAVLAQGLGNLARLHLGGCDRLTDAVGAALEPLHLRELDLSHLPKLSDAGLRDLAAAPHLPACLKRLSLNGCVAVTDAGVRWLAALTSLQQLDLEGCWQLNGDGLVAVTAMPWLRRLTLRGCERLRDDGVAVLPALAASLTRVDLSRCYGVTDDSASALAQCTALTHLDLAHSRVSDAGLRRVTAIAALTQLNLSHCEVTGAGLAHVAEGRRLTALTHLDLSSSDVCEEGVGHLCRLPALRTLNLSECAAATDAGLRHLLHNTSLTRLSLTGCETSQAAEDELRRQIPGLVIEHPRTLDEGDDAED